MQAHGRRVGYFVLGEGLLLEPHEWLGGASFDAEGSGASAAPPVQVPALAFGRMFGKTRHELTPDQRKDFIDKLVTLGRCMNGDPDVGCPLPAETGPDESDIPAGYTYLGQFIAHEVTFDSTGNMLEEGMNPVNLRTPQIDLDSLYRNGPQVAANGDLYDSDGIHLKVGQTLPIPRLNQQFPNDLPREPKSGKALLGDPRNDENLLLAQTHLAFIKFHNKIVDVLRAEGHPEGELFERAREQTVRHLQWLILEDYLPRLVPSDVLKSVRTDGNRWFKIEDEGVLFMPLEFSAAAFRIGHSMVRPAYELNHYHSSGYLGGGLVSLLELFRQTNFSGNLGGSAPTRLQSDWIIDWRHFYDFTDSTYPKLSEGRMNLSAKLDTVLALHLDKVEKYPDNQKNLIAKMQRAITVRNLLRGFYLSLPTGEEVAQKMGLIPLTSAEITDGPHGKLLGDEAFKGKTPLWYYILKEAELGGGKRLGPVGGRIVAETLVGLIRHSCPSILAEPGWRPIYGRPGNGDGTARFAMIDLLNFADVVDPIGRHLQNVNSH